MRPSSGALQTLTAATGVCHELGWNKSCLDVQDRLRSSQPILNIYTVLFPFILLCQITVSLIEFLFNIETQRPSKQPASNIITTAACACTVQVHLLTIVSARCSKFHTHVYLNP